MKKKTWHTHTQAKTYTMCHKRKKRKKTKKRKKENHIWTCVWTHVERRNRKKKDE
jgi:hypothetical protein